MHTMTSVGSPGKFAGLALFLGLVSGACTHPRAPEPAPSPPGYLITGPGVSYWRLHVGDSLPEVGQSTIASALADAATAEARKIGFDSRCNRYFQGTTYVLALVVAKCEEGVEVDDGMGITALKLDGTLIGPTAPMLHDEFAKLVPFRRNRR